MVMVSRKGDSTVNAIDDLEDDIAMIEVSPDLAR